MTTATTTAGPGTAVLTAAGLTKTYGDRRAVDGVDLRVQAGQVYGFLGPNGAGKTTTLRMLLGLVRPTAGRARVHGLPPGDPAALRRTGSLVEGPGFHPYLSGRDNLRVLARTRALPDRDVDEVLERVDLADRGGDRFRTYSLGMKQRLGVAGAILGGPDLLVLDEPTNGLDPAGMAAMRALIAELAAGGRTVVLSSHLMSEVEQVCDHVAVIARGRVVYDGTVEQMRGGRRLRVRAEPLSGAVAVVESLAGTPELIDLDGGGSALQLDADGIDVPRLTRELVTAGLDVHEIGIRERSLEERFLAMTGEPA